MAAFGGENIWTASSDGDLERVQHLLEKEGVDVNAQDEHGYSPIHAAASHGQLALLEFLLQEKERASHFATRMATPRC